MKTEELSKIIWIIYFLHPLLFTIGAQIFENAFIISEENELIDDCNSRSQSDNCSEVWAYEAIKILHRQMDDDEDGSVDVEESDEFIREELNYAGNSEKKRQQVFHKADNLISVKDLWNSWQKSEVHNWTTAEIVYWLETVVELPMYKDSFIKNEIRGIDLPHLATNSQFLSNVLRIDSGIHKQKMTLKAIDVVLFGPPKNRNYWKDKLLLSLIAVALGGCWLAYVQHRKSKIHLQKMLKDMDNLQKAEENLRLLQKKLEQAKTEKEDVLSMNQKLKSHLSKESMLGSVEKEFSELETENMFLRDELTRLNNELKEHRWVAPRQLKLWLQVTFELEQKSFNQKKEFAEKQLRAARDSCEKLKRKRALLIGSFLSTHDKYADEVDECIFQARSHLMELTNEIQERATRWGQIQKLCNFDIIHNPGLRDLENMLSHFPVNETLFSNAFSSDVVPTLLHQSGTSINLHHQNNKEKVTNIVQSKSSANLSTASAFDSSALSFINHSSGADEFPRHPFNDCISLEGIQFRDLSKKIIKNKKFMQNVGKSLSHDSSSPMFQIAVPNLINESNLSKSESIIDNSDSVMKMNIDDSQSTLSADDDDSVSQQADNDKKNHLRKKKLLASFSKIIKK